VREGTRNAVAITVLNVFRGFAENVYRVFISAYMAKLGYSMASIGLVSALSSIIGALASPLVGFLLDVWSSRFITALTGFFTVASLLLVAFGGGVEVITISYALFSLAFYFAQPECWRY
jgi:MFS family permease